MVSQASDVRLCDQCLGPSGIFLRGASQRSCRDIRTNKPKGVFPHVTDCASITRAAQGTAHCLAGEQRARPCGLERPGAQFLSTAGVQHSGANRGHWRVTGRDPFGTAWTWRAPELPHELADTAASALETHDIHKRLAMVTDATVRDAAVLLARAREYVYVVTSRENFTARFLQLGTRTASLAIGECLSLDHPRTLARGNQSDVSLAEWRTAFVLTHFPHSPIHSLKTPDRQDPENQTCVGGAGVSQPLQDAPKGRESVSLSLFPFPSSLRPSAARVALKDALVVWTFFRDFALERVASMFFVCALLTLTTAWSSHCAYSSGSFLLRHVSLRTFCQCFQGVFPSLVSIRDP